MGKSAWFSVAAACALFAVVFLLLRENEARVSAQNKLKDLLFSVETQTNRQAGLVTDLEAQITEWEGKFGDTVSRYNEELRVKSAEIERLNGETERLNGELESAGQRYSDAVKQHEARVGVLQADARSAEDRFNESMRTKSKEMADLGAQLERSSSQIAQLLKDKAALESQLMDARQKAAAAQKELESQRTANATLQASLTKTAEKSEPILD